jgi:hypothetical protein
MLCSPRTISTANVILAILVVGGYAIYGRSCGFEIDKCFLCFEPLHFSKHMFSPLISSWKWVVIVECALFSSIVGGSLLHWDMRLPKAICFLFCAFGVIQLFFSLLQQVIHPNGVVSSVEVSHLDFILFVYVWASHLFYGICGSGGKGVGPHY